MNKIEIPKFKQLQYFTNINYGFTQLEEKTPAYNIYENNTLFRYLTTSIREYYHDI